MNYKLPMKQLLFLTFLLTLFQLHAQTTLISGKVVIDDADEVINLDRLSITNLNTHARTTANEKGLFSIKVNVNDELVFEQIGIQSRQLKITEAILKKGFVTIHLNVDVIELAEANIHPLKKYWKDNLTKEELESEKINKDLGINQEFKNDMVKAYFAANYFRKLGVIGRYENVMGMIDQYSDDEVQTYKHFLKKKKLDKYEKIEVIKAYFTDYYFEHDLKIPQGNILDFIHYCFIDIELDRSFKANDYDKISSILEEQAPIYLSKMNIKSSENE